MAILQAFAGTTIQNLPRIATITATVAGDSGLHSIPYTNTGGVVTAISVNTSPTLGTIQIVQTSLVYLSPKYLGDLDPKFGIPSHTGTELDTFSLNFTGPGGTITVLVVITITAT